MEQIIEDFTSGYEKLKKETNMHISTMTVVVETSNEIKIHEVHQKEIPKYFSERSCDIQVPKGRKTGDEFMNQFTLKFMEGKSRKNVKMFPNGRLHMTGIKHINDVLKICDELKEYIGEFAIDNINICLINCNFNIGIGMDIRKLATILKTVDDELLYLPFSFQDPNKYPGLRFKYNDTTMLIFSSGAIMFAGGKTIQKIDSCYNFITNLIHSYKDQINCPKLFKIRKSPN